jgi:hypothetical protein
MSCLHRNLRLEACYPCKEAHFKVRDPSSTRASSGRKVAHDVAKRRVRPCLAEFVIVTNTHDNRWQLGSLNLSLSTTTLIPHTPISSYA